MSTNPCFPVSHNVLVTYVHPVTGLYTSQVATVQATSEEEALVEARSWVLNLGATFVSGQVVR